MQLPLSQLETPHIKVPVVTALPLSVALSTSALVIFEVVVPDNDHWFILTGGGQLAFDSAQMSLSSGISAIFPRGAITGSDPLAAIAPMSVVNFVSANAGYAAVTIPGSEMSAGQQLRIIVEVKNADGAAAHNVTTSSYMNLLVRPARLVTEIAVSGIMSQGVGQEQLRQRLRR